jgi:nucleoside-diphosphate-sugar epimerase
MPSAFVTGGTGFVGLNLIEQLTTRGWNVTALHRPTSNLKYIRRFSPRLAVGSITDAASLMEAVPASVDVVFHVAGNTSFWSRKNAVQTRDNVDGTRNVVRAALARKAKRFVHTSSDAAYGLHDAVKTEQTVSNAKSSWVNYLRTKWLAEQEVRAGMKSGLDAVCLNPANILGPYDFHNWSRMISLVKTGKLAGVPPGSGSFCHVREVAKAHIAAAERGRSGENYLLGGTDTSYLELTRVIADVTGGKAPKRPLPAALLRVVGRVSLWASYVTGKEPDITPEIALILSHDDVCDCSKAERELGFKRVPLREMVEDAYAWMVREDYPH